MSFKKAISTKFKLSLKSIKNPYGDGKSSAKIVDQILKTNINVMSEQEACDRY